MTYADSVEERHEQEHLRRGSELSDHRDVVCTPCTDQVSTVSRPPESRANAHEDSRSHEVPGVSEVELPSYAPISLDLVNAKEREGRATDCCGTRSHR